MDNLKKLCSVLQEDVDGLILSSRENRRYCAGVDIAEGMAIVSKAGCIYLTDSRYLEAAKNRITGFEVLEVDGGSPYTTRLVQAIEALHIHNLGFEEERWSVGEYQNFQKATGILWTPYQAQISQFRASKDPQELALMRRAQAITDQTYCQLLEMIRPSMTEKELAAELIYRLYRNGADGLSFDPIVVSGPNTSMPHGVPSERKLQRGDFVTMDFGCMVDGYCSDMTRTVALGYVTEDMQQVYETVLLAQTTAIAASRAGMTGREIDAIARAVISDAGFGAQFGHSYGHSLGLEIHEAPNCSPSNTSPIPVGAVCSAEPGIYLPGQFGVRIEDVVVFREGGVENLTKSDKQLCILSC